jgi:hypothetical protein
MSGRRQGNYKLAVENKQVHVRGCDGGNQRQDNRAMACFGSKKLSAGRFG